MNKKGRGVSAASSHVTRPSRPARPGPACSQPQPGGRMPGPASLTAPARRPDPGARLAHGPSQEAGSKARPGLLTTPAGRPDPGARLAHSPSQEAGSKARPGLLTTP